MPNTNDIARNKDLVRQICKHLSARDLPAMFDLIHDDGSWSIPYRPDRFQFAGFRTKPELREMLEGFLGIFESFQFEISNMTAEDDRVVIEAKSQAVGPAGVPYQNVYVLVFFIKDGKAHTVREYFDPFQALAFVEQLPTG
jgi:ketosteroid isomerase-like protein